MPRALPESAVEARHAAQRPKYARLWRVMPHALRCRHAATVFVTPTAEFVASVRYEGYVEGERGKRGYESHARVAAKYKQRRRVGAQPFDGDEETAAALLPYHAAMPLRMPRCMLRVVSSVRTYYYDGTRRYTHGSNHAL